MNRGFYCIANVTWLHNNEVSSQTEKWECLKKRRLEPFRSVITYQLCKQEKLSRVKTWKVKLKSLKWRKLLIKMLIRKKAVFFFLIRYFITHNNLLIYSEWKSVLSWGYNWDKLTRRTSLGDYRVRSTFSPRWEEFHVMNPSEKLCKAVHQSSQQNNSESWWVKLLIWETVVLCPSEWTTPSRRPSKNINN